MSVQTNKDKVTLSGRRAIPNPAVLPSGHKRWGGQLGPVREAVLLSSLLFFLGLLLVGYGFVTDLVRDSLYVTRTIDPG